MKNSCEQLQASDHAPRQVDPGVIELPRGNELSPDHVNRPLDKVLKQKKSALCLKPLTEIGCNDNDSGVVYD